MKTRLFGIAVPALLCAAVCAAAGEEKDKDPASAAKSGIAAAVARLPEVIARRGGETVSRSEIEAALLADPFRRHLAAHPEELLPTVHRLAEQRIGMKIMLAKLRERRIAVDGETARSYIDRHTRRFGDTPAARHLRGQLEALADAPQFRLKAAIHRFFEETVPRAVEVTDLEIERAYRLDQKRFLQPPRIDCGVISVRRSRKDAESAADAAAARLRQGEPFERVAAEIDPAGAGGGALPPLEELTKLAEGEVAVIRGTETISVVMLRRKIPASYIPLAEAAPLLAEELSAVRAGRAMERLLTAELAAEPIQFDPGLSSAAAPSVPGGTREK